MAWEYVPAYNQGVYANHERIALCGGFQPRTLDLKCERLFNKTYSTTKPTNNKRNKPKMCKLDECVGNVEA